MWCSRIGTSDPKADRNRSALASRYPRSGARFDAEMAGHTICGTCFDPASPFFLWLNVKRRFQAVCCCWCRVVNPATNSQLL